MSPISRTKVKERLKDLLTDEEGVLVLLCGGLMISDFDDPEVALDEAIKAFKGNQSYFRRLMERAKNLSDSQ